MMMLSTFHSFQTLSDGVRGFHKTVNTCAQGDSENSEDMCRDSADERSCGFSWASGHSIVEDSAVWPRMTNHSGTDSGLLTNAPQAGADLSLGSSVVSDCMGLFPGASGWFACVRNSTAGRVSRTLATGSVSVIIAAQKAPMVWLKLTHVFGTTAPPLKLTILPLRAHQSALLPPSHQQV